MKVKTNTNNAPWNNSIRLPNLFDIDSAVVERIRTAPHDSEYYAVGTGDVYSTWCPKLGLDQNQYGDIGNIYKYDNIARQWVELRGVRIKDIRELVRIGSNADDQEFEIGSVCNYRDGGESGVCVIMYTYRIHGEWHSVIRDIDTNAQFNVKVKPDTFTYLVENSNDKFNKSMENFLNVLSEITKTQTIRLTSLEPHDAQKLHDIITKGMSL
jgi:hypothetical protein